LRLADHDLDDRAFHPPGLPAQRFELAAEALACVGISGSGQLSSLRAMSA
jgi:hypothetical protein